MGGIKIGPGNSRREIAKKLEDLEKQKDNGYITLEEYDTLRIRYERKLGNREAVSKLQERKGFKPSKIAEKKELKEELYDDFVDQYAKRENENAQKEASASSIGKGTKRLILIVFVLLAFTVGMVAGLSALNTQASQTQTNVTVADSAFPDVISATNNTQNATNMTNVTTTKKYKKSSTKTYSNSSSTKSYNSSSNSYDSSYSGSSGSNYGNSKYNSYSSGSSSNSRSSSGSSSSSSRGSSSSGY